MSFMTTAFLMEKYGPLLTTEEVATVLKIDPQTVRNQRSAGAFPLEGKKQGKSVVYHAEDVARHLDSFKAAA